MSHPMSDDEEEIDENRARIVYTSSMYHYTASDVAAGGDYNVGYGWAGLYQNNASVQELPPQIQHQVNPQERDKILFQREADEQLRQRSQEIHRAKANRFSHDSDSRRAVQMDYIEMGLNTSADENKMMCPVLVGHRRSRENWER